MDILTLNLISTKGVSVSGFEEWGLWALYSCLSRELKLSITVLGDARWNVRSSARQERCLLQVKPSTLPRQRPSPDQPRCKKVVDSFKTGPRSQPPTSRLHSADGDPVRKAGRRNARPMSGCSSFTGHSKPGIDRFGRPLTQYQHHAILDPTSCGRWERGTERP